MAYMVWAAFLFITGLSFVLTLILDHAATLAQNFQVIGLVLLFIVPLLTMRSLAEESKSGTLELLLTAPIRDGEVVLGKFFAALIFFVIMLLPTLYYLFLLTCFGMPNIPMTFSGYLGVLLLGAMLISFGILASALLSTPITAAIMSVGISLTFILFGRLAYLFPGMGGDTLRYLSIQEHYADFLSGLISSTHIIYFLSFTTASLFLATRMLEAKRWS